jgi:hypothetical protein
MNRVLSFLTHPVQTAQRWLSHPDAGAELRRAEASGRVVVHGEDPATCLVEVVVPALPPYDPPPRLPMDAWIAAWRVARFPRHEREQAIRQDLTHFRAGLLVLARLELRDDPSLPDVVARVRFDEAVAVAHHWFLLAHHGIERGMRHYAAMLAQVRAVDVEVEARLILAGLAICQSSSGPDGHVGGDSREVR